MRKIVWLLFGILFLAMMQSTLAARRLGPPIEMLREDPDRIRIVTAVVSEKLDQPGIRFTVSGRLSGDALNEILLRMDKETHHDLEVGRSYIVAWTYMRRNRRVIGGWETDIAGPSVVSIEGMGATAVFEDTAELRLLFSGMLQNEPDAAIREKEALLTQLQRPDSRSRSLVISELYLRPDLTENFGKPQAAILKSVIEAHSLTAQQQDVLLRSASRLPQELTAPWLAEEYRRIISKNGAQYDLGSFVPALVRTAARGLQQNGTPADVELLGTLLYSNNPGVAKAALNSMSQLDHRATVSAVEKALTQGEVHGDTRTAMESLLRQSASPP